MTAAAIKLAFWAALGATATLAVPFFATAAEPDALAAFFAKIPACSAYEFQDAREIKGFAGGRLSLTDLKKAAGQLVRPMRLNAFYFGIHRPGLSENLNALVSSLEKEGYTDLAYDDLLAASRARFQSARQKREIGECVRMELPGGARFLFQPKVEVATLTVDAWDRIRAAFNEDANRCLRLSEREYQLIRMKQITETELYELRAIRRAVHILQMQTVMRDKKAGGFVANITGELAGNGQLSADSQSKSVQNFLRLLQARNLLQEIKRFGPIDIPPDPRNLFHDPANMGHTATGLVLPSTGRIVVVDTWFEDGKTPPHVVWEDAWVRFSLWRKNIFIDVAQMAPNPVERL